MAVYVIQNNGKLNFNKAKKHGKLISLIERDAFPDDAEDRIMVIHDIMKAKLRNFNMNRDFLLLTGAPEAIAMAIWVLTDVKGVSSIPALKWDRENRGYYKLKIADY
jgi:hypothetical protein